MRLCLWVPLLLCVSIPAGAAPVSYTFSGTWGRGFLDVGSGLIDVTGVDFVATGTTLGDVPQEAACDFCRYVSTTTYSFGDVGSFTTDGGGDMFTQYGTSDGITSLALQKWVDGMIDFIGFRVSTNPIGDPQVLAPLGEVTLTSSIANIGHGRRQSNLAGHYLSLEHSLSTQLTVTHAEIYAVTVPEPSTTVLATFAVILALIRRTRHMP